MKRISLSLAQPTCPAGRRHDLTISTSITLTRKKSMRLLELLENPATSQREVQMSDGCLYAKIPATPA